MQICVLMLKILCNTITLYNSWQMHPRIEIFIYRINQARFFVGTCDEFMAKMGSLCCYPIWGQDIKRGCHCQNVNKHFRIYIFSGRITAKLTDPFLSMWYCHIKQQMTYLQVRFLRMYRLVRNMFVYAHNIGRYVFARDENPTKTDVIGTFVRNI